MKLAELKDKKILILGFGREGRDSFRFLRRIFPEKVIGIADKREFPLSNFPAHLASQGDEGGQFSNVNWHLGKKYLKALKNYDTIIKSPGIPIHLPEIEKAYREKKITSATEIFFENCSGKIIGVTGTKGKGTTASLIYKILKRGGKRVHLIGNIGKPALSFLFSDRAENVYVYELSSHQLYNLKRSPQIAVFLNIYPDHLDYYKNFKEYVKAKANIARYQTRKDYLIYNFQDKIIKEIAKKSKAKKIAIKGVYYDLNKNAARAVGKLFEIPRTIIEKVIGQTKPLPHRLEYIGQYRGIKFFNDSASSIPESTLAALDALGDKVETVLLGGSDKKLDFRNLAQKILKSKIKNLILFPTTGEKIWQEITKMVRGRVSRQLPRNFFVDNMKEAVKLAYQYTQKGKICLLSCASASFSIFRDYKERGNLFKKYVRSYGKKT